MPSLDQVRTSGIVTLPGAFIGVMLGGGSAVQAATAQVLVLFAIMATQAITAGVQAELIRRRLLLAPDLRVARLLSLSSPGLSDAASSGAPPRAACRSASGTTR